MPATGTVKKKKNGCGRGIQMKEWIKIALLSRVIFVSHFPCCCDRNSLSVYSALWIMEGFSLSWQRRRGVKSRRG